MSKKPCLILLFIALISNFISCNNTKTTSDNRNYESVQSKNDSVIYSFAFMGCNRVDPADKYAADPVFHSTANVYALERTIDDMITYPVKPDIFFLLGDIVIGEQDINTLDTELSGWINLFNNKFKSKISAAGIEVIAVPGNHEMLYQYPEIPLSGATSTWLKHMNIFLPAGRDTSSGDKLDNRLTFSFVRKKTAFIVMNTDSYQYPDGGDEGQIPLNWITSKMNQYRSDPSIDNIFLLGHKPYYNFCQSSTGHAGLPQGEALWNGMVKQKVTAMLSAHIHDYQRLQPAAYGGPYQVVAGNGGSPLDSRSVNKYFGYTIVQVMSNGKARLVSRGYSLGDPYYSGKNSGPFTTLDSMMLTWNKQAPDFPQYCK